MSVIRHRYVAPRICTPLLYRLVSYCLRSIFVCYGMMEAFDGEQH